MHGSMNVKTSAFAFINIPQMLQICSFITDPMYNLSQLRASPYNA